MGDNVKISIFHLLIFYLLSFVQEDKVFLLLINVKDRQLKLKLLVMISHFSFLVFPFFSFYAFHTYPHIYLSLLILHQEIFKILQDIFIILFVVLDRGLMIFVLSFQGVFYQNQNNYQILILEMHHHHHHPFSLIDNLKFFFNLF